jgi:TetR/AcrR family transcriptional regulator, transcriptional repressor for nem operon
MTSVILTLEMTVVIYTWVMRHSQQEKARTHDRIVEIAARRIREAGTDGPGVAELMSAAGLTHGGFYKHFASRDELIAEATEKALADGTRGSAAAIAGAQNPLTAFVNWYLSPDHVANPGSGCAVAALGNDAPRADARVRRAYTEQVERYLADMRALMGDDATDAAAATAVSAMVGAIVLARAVDDPELSTRILESVAATLT